MYPFFLSMPIHSLYINISPVLSLQQTTAVPHLSIPVDTESVLDGAVPFP